MKKGESRVDAALARLVAIVPPERRWLAGVGLLVFAAWLAFYGHLWSFERLEEARFTSRSILSGTLRLRDALSLVQNDEQIYDGAAYTNWGFGVPLLQAPFHALAAAAGILHGFFPDRAIFFVYEAATIPIVWAAVHRLLALRPRHTASERERMALSWTATWVVFASVLFPITSTRFVIYEEAIAYFTLAQLLAIGAYAYALPSWRALPLASLGAAAGVGLLVRPTGVLYVGFWCAVVLLEGRGWRRLAFLGTLLPCVAFWLYSNLVRTGTYTGLGYPNSTPAWIYNLPIERFGSRCSDTAAHALLGAARLWTGFFLLVTHRASAPWLHDCHFDFEERAGYLPYFGPIVLGAVCWVVRGLWVRRERRLTRYLPYLAMAALFASFVHRGMGFCWRYTADFWPFILVGVVQHVLDTPAAPPVVRGVKVTKALLFYGACVYVTFLVPWFWSPVPEIVPVSEAAAMEQHFRDSLDRVDPPVAARLSCGDALAPVFQNGAGWRADCAVDTFTNVVLGVPPRSSGTYRLRARYEGEGADALRVYVNGRFYTARRAGDFYEAEVTIPYARLVSPAVVVTWEWTRAPEPPRGRLLSVELS